MTRAKLHLTFPEHLISETMSRRIGTEFGLVTNVHRANLEEAGRLGHPGGRRGARPRGRGHRMAHRPGPQVAQIED